MKRRVVITGLGTVNPLGNNVSDFWGALCAGRSGIGPITRFDAADFQTRIAGDQLVRPARSASVVLPS